MRVNWSVLLFLKIVCFVVSVKSFSYNINARTVFKPNDGLFNDQSYFGYSVLLRDGANPMIIVGAPQDSLQHENYRNIKNTGVIYYCPISTNTTDSCFQKTLDPSGNQRKHKANGKSVHHRKQSMWLGMSMDGTTFNNGTLVMCAPRWKNQFYPDHYFINGLCYSVADTLKPQEESNANILIPLIDYDNQGYKYSIQNAETGDDEEKNGFFYIYGQAGISTKLSDDGTELLIGAPGVFDWKGTVIRYKKRKNYDRNTQDSFYMETVSNPYFIPELTDDGYFGYSVGFGKFATNTHEVYVAGAPRSSNLNGDVTIFTFYKNSQNKYIKLAKLMGKQFGEYFGSVVATIDINQDGLTDLLIGAPMHAKPLAWDQGKVYVYMNQDKFQFKEQETNICGSFHSGGRFGSAISPIGDINNDGFTDVAIGSPYEEYGRGAVYIYLGSQNGLNPQYTQRIVVDNTEGFGISISKGVDIDKNTCNDIAIGAYMSSEVILLKCHPSVYVIPKIETIPSELLLNSTSFIAHICLQFIGHKSFTTDIEARLFVDVNYNRASIESRSEKLIVISGKGGTESCKDIEIDIETSLADFSRPIELKMAYNLEKNPLNEMKFCENCTVLRPTDKKELMLQVPFASGCANLTCQPDLKLNVNLMTTFPYIIGSSKSLNIKISLENIGEPAYVTKTKMFLSQKLPLLKVPFQCNIEESNELICDFENPLYRLKKKLLILEFDTSMLASVDDIISFNITALSGGNEVTPEDNNAFVQLQFKPFSKVEVLGVPDRNQFVYIKKNTEPHHNLSITHSYDIFNNGPSRVDLFTVTFYLPVEYYDILSKERYNLINVSEPVGYLNGQRLICNPVQGDFLETEKKRLGCVFSNHTTEIYYTTTESPINIYSTEIIQGSNTMLLEDEKSLGINNKLIPNLKLTEFSKTMYLNCSNTNLVSCMRVQCTASKLNHDSTGVHITLNMLVNVSSFEKILEDTDISILSTFSKVDVLQPNIEQVSFGYVSSFIFNSQLPSAAVSLWIYILAIILGVVLLALIIYALYKFGFFKRKRMSELTLLKNQENSNNDTEERIDKSE